MTDAEPASLKLASLLSLHNIESRPIAINHALTKPLAAKGKDKGGTLTIMKLVGAIPLLASAFSISNALEQESAGKCG